MHIYIPTLSRPDRQFTLKSIPDKLLKKTHLVINKEEYKLYKKHHPKEMLMIVKKKVKNIAQVRQYILENSYSKYSLFLDDDMNFSYRKAGKLVKCKKKHFYKMYKQLLKWLEEGYIHVGVSQRAGNNRIEESFVEVTRMNNIYAYNAKETLKAGARFDRLPIMEDFDITLTLLRQGFPNIVTYDYCWGQRKSGDDGGCSTYRTAEMQRAAALALSKLHPGLVKVKAKKAKVDWGGIGGKYRTDVNIYWKKAYKIKKRTGNAEWLYGRV